MDLQSLGFDDWFGAHASAMLQPGQSVARVMTVDRGAFLVRNERGETVAELSGKFRFAVESSPDLPCVGDWVCVDHTSPTLAIIHAVLPRKTFLRRKCPGKTVDFQMIATNLDVAFIVQSCHYDFNIRRLDRYLVAANEGHIEPIVILSKTDLVSPEELDGMIARIRDAGISAQLLPISNTTGSGLEDVSRASLCRARRSVCSVPRESERPLSSIDSSGETCLTPRPSAEREKACTQPHVVNCSFSTTARC